MAWQCNDNNCDGSIVYNFTGSFHMMLNLSNADNDYLGDYLDDYLGDYPDNHLDDYLQPGVQRATARALLAAARHRLSVLFQVR